MCLAPRSRSTSTSCTATPPASWPSSSRLPPTASNDQQRRWPTAQGSIQFVHEARHRNELYRLQGVSSPSHGITRPLRLAYRQLQRPQTQCCAACGEPGHAARKCPRRSSAAVLDADKMEVDFVPLAPDAVVCRLCYKTGHQGTCNTSLDAQTCKLCNATGHTSFRCRQYRATWVPLTAPASTRPPNLRPQAIIAQQRGVSYSQAATAGANSLAPPPSLASQARLNDIDFPSLPNQRLWSPASSTASSMSTTPPLPSPTDSQPHSSTPDMAGLTALVASLAASVKEMRRELVSSRNPAAEIAGLRAEVLSLSQTMHGMMSYLSTIQKQPATAAHPHPFATHMDTSGLTKAVPFLPPHPSDIDVHMQDDRTAAAHQSSAHRQGTTQAPPAAPNVSFLTQNNAGTGQQVVNQVPTNPAASPPSYLASSSTTSSPPSTQ